MTITMVLVMIMTKIMMILMLVAPRSLIKSAALKEEVLEYYELKMDCLNRAVFETKCVIS